MEKFYAYIDKSTNSIIGTGTCKMSSDSANCIEISEKLYNDTNDVNGKDKYIYDTNTNTLMDNPEYENIIKAKEKERVAMLKMTPRDFLLACTQKLGIEWSKLKELMDTNAQVAIELQFCNHVYRGNPLLDQLAGQFGVTSEQLDNLFKVANGEVVTTKGSEEEVK